MKKQNMNSLVVVGCVVLILMAMWVITAKRKSSPHPTLTTSSAVAKAGCNRCGGQKQSVDEN